MNEELFVITVSVFKIESNIQLMTTERYLATSRIQAAKCINDRIPHLVQYNRERVGSFLDNKIDTLSVWSSASDHQNAIDLYVHPLSRL